MAIARYHVKLEIDEDGFYIASVPALRGCHSDGRTREEALANIQEAMELWIEADDEMAIRSMPEHERRLLTTVSLPIAA